MVSSETVHRILASTLELKNIREPSRSVSIIHDRIRIGIFAAAFRKNPKCDQCEKHPLDVSNRRKRTVSNRVQNHSLALMRET
ncbi:hypothetical protein Pla100_22330 [Neorhodopirellula pilleata]|uniref:Uncharacterized protein n=1 Tax=Neorhodopirellula pilleata TaxID=2714738 RepID=A0A5C6AHV4_9BACT|nr:hypothetical protein Pla100_22330 [Neorhodopirellula pilleata]